MTQVLMRLWIGQEGQDLVEYALLVAIIGLACVAGMSGLATAINTAFTNAGTNLASGTGT